MSNAYLFYEKSGEVDDCLINPPIIPDRFLYVWEWFLELNSQRQQGNPISWGDIYSYFSLVGVQPHKHDLELIRELDWVFLDVMNSEDKGIALKGG